MKSGLLAMVRTALLVLVTVSLSAPVGAAEPYEPFLNGLRDRQLFDMALLYLEQMRTSPLITAEQQREVPYEEGVTYVAFARAERDINAKNVLLDKATEKFRQFIDGSSGHPRVGEASIQLGNVLVERARGLVDSAGRPANVAQKDQLLKQARDTFDQAREVFEAAERKYEEELATYPKFIGPADKDLLDRRDRCRGNLIQAQLFHATVLFESAATFPKGNANWKATLQAAADKYEKLYESQRTRIAGLVARMKQGQCYQEMGDTKRAVGLYSNVLDQPEDLEELRKLRAGAMHLALQCWIEAKDLQVAVLKGEEFLTATRQNEAPLPDWLAVRYQTALAHNALAETFTDKQQEPARKQHTDRARDLADFVARYSGGYQEAAKALVKEIRGTTPADRREPTNFADATERGKAALEDMSRWQAAIQRAPAMNEKDKIPEYQENLLTAREQAARYFQMALDLRADNTPIDDVNIVRYYLCYLQYQMGNFYDAAVLGEFLARRYPNSSGGRQGAKLAMAGYVAEYSAARKKAAAGDAGPAGDAAFDKAKVVDVAELIAQRWAGEAEAEEAYTVLLAIATSEKDIDKARDYLTHIPDGSPRRADSELKVGRAMWEAYLAELRKDEADRKPAAELETLAQEAKASLEKGIERLRGGIESPDRVDDEVGAAVLVLSQIYVVLGESEKAVTFLEDSVFGPLSLIEAKTAVAEQGKFATESYKLALRAYVATQALDKAERMMQALEESASEGGAAELTRIYIALGQELEQQVGMLRRNPEKAAELERVSKGFELFLDKISQREQGNTFSSLNWVAETFYSLGAGYATGDATTLPPEAVNYLGKSLQVDEKILDQSRKDPSFAPGEDAALAVTMRTARTYRKMGKYKEAVEKIAEVLRVKPMLLDAQAECAYTLQDWGAQNPLYLTLAINGAVRQKNPMTGMEENLIWGWAMLANRTQSDLAKFKDQYHEARYNLARSRLMQAMAKTGSEKAELLKRADNDIYITGRFVPDLGGDEWKEKYDSLLKTIQKAAGVKPDGLKAHELRAQQAQQVSR